MRISHAVVFTIALLPAIAAGQRGAMPATPRSDSLKHATQLDLDGDTGKARAILMKLIDGAPDPMSKAQLQRALAISYAFTSDCTKASVQEEQVIAYWVTQEQAEPQNAFYQEGEVSNEAARICFDAGDYATAETYYRRGSELGLKEPAPKTHPASLWDFRLTHALARIAVREGKLTAAKQFVARARAILDSDKKMAEQQERFFPYLAGFVQFYSSMNLRPEESAAAERLFKQAIDFPGNENDPYMYWLLADLYSRNQRTTEQMMDYCRRALARATAHNPPSAFVHVHAKECLAPLR
jgi:tetratricopeptide (TPR) repeat protein